MKYVFWNISSGFSSEDCESEVEAKNLSIANDSEYLGDTEEVVKNMKAFIKDQE